MEWLSKKSLNSSKSSAYVKIQLFQFIVQANKFLFEYLILLLYRNTEINKPRQTTILLSNGSARISIKLPHLYLQKMLKPIKANKNKSSKFLTVWEYSFICRFKITHNNIANIAKRSPSEAFLVE